MTLKLKDWLTPSEINQVSHENHDEWLAIAEARAKAAEEPATLPLAEVVEEDEPDEE